VTTYDLVRGTNYTTTYTYAPVASELEPAPAEVDTGVYNTLALETNVQTTNTSGTLIRAANVGPFLHIH
jgi:hypothetical protein